MITKKRGRKPKAPLSCLDLDGQDIFNDVKVEENQSGIFFSTKEIEMLKVLVGYFHSFYYGQDKLGTLQDLKLVTDRLLREKNQGIVEVLKEVSDEEYTNFWNKLV